MKLEEERIEDKGKEEMGNSFSIEDEGNDDRER